MKILYISVWIFLIKQTACQWIDPHDMNTNAKEKYMKPTLKKSSSTGCLSTGELNADSKLCFSHIKRIVGVLITSAHIDRRNPDVYYGNIRFNIDPNDLDFLLNIGKENLELDKLRKLDTIFSESFKKSFINEYMEQIEDFQLKLHSIVVNVHNLWLLGATFLLYIVYQLFKNNFSFAYILKYLTIMVFICDFVFRYQYLLEEAEEHNLRSTYSAKCDTAKMGWGEWASFWLSKKDCERKTVTPLDALLFQVKNVIIIPLHALGTGMGGFGSNMFTNLPWGLNLIMWPLMMIFAIIIFVFTMVICTGQAIEFNAFHLIKLKFGGTKQKDNNEKKLMDSHLHRPLVQNITISVPTGDKSGTELQSESNIDPSDKTVTKSHLKNEKITESKAKNSNENKSALETSKPYVCLDDSETKKKVKKNKRISTENKKICVKSIENVTKDIVVCDKSSNPSSNQIKSKTS